MANEVPNSNFAPREAPIQLAKVHQPSLSPDPTYLPHLVGKSFFLPQAGVVTGSGIMISALAMFLLTQAVAFVSHGSNNRELLKTMNGMVSDVAGAAGKVTHYVADNLLDSINDVAGQKHHDTVASVIQSNPQTMPEYEAEKQDMMDARGTDMSASEVQAAAAAASDKGRD